MTTQLAPYRSQAGTSDYPEVWLSLEGGTKNDLRRLHYADVETWSNLTCITAIHLWRICVRRAWELPEFACTDLLSRIWEAMRSNNLSFADLDPATFYTRPEDWLHVPGVNAVIADILVRHELGHPDVFLACRTEDLSGLQSARSLQRLHNQLSARQRWLQ